MKGSIHTALRCPVCGVRLKSDEPKGLVCPNHPQTFHEGPCRVMFDNVTTRFSTYREAYKVLTRKRSEVDAGTYDVRDYQIKSKPLAFSSLSEEWLSLKKSQLKKGSWRNLAGELRKATTVWGSVNIKSILYSHIEDYFLKFQGLPKTKLNALNTFKQFFAWCVERYEIPPIKKWPKLGFPEMAFRQTVDIPTQEAIISDIQKNEPFRVWLCIKWLATYIAIRPGEMRSLNESHVDRVRGLLIVPHSKERRSKVIPLISEDIELVRSLPLAFDNSTPFFRHERSYRGGVMAGDRLAHNTIYRAWKSACDRLGVAGVSLYPGTKHSTAMGLRAIYTPEQIMAQTLHRTGAAFRRYFQTGGEDLRSLFEGRKTLARPDNGPTMVSTAPRWP